MAATRQDVPVAPAPSLPVTPAPAIVPALAPVLAPMLMMAFWMLLGGAAGIRLMGGLWRFLDVQVREVSIVVPVGGGVGALGGALLGLISNPRLLVLLMAVFAGSAAGADAGKLPWGDVGEIGGQVAGGLVGGIAWAAWLYFEANKKAVLPSRAATDPGRLPQRLQVIAFDLDAVSMIALRHAVPEWAIKVVNGASASSLSNDWNPGEADLLIVQAGADAAETLGLCRFLAFCTAYSGDSRKGSAASGGALNNGNGQEPRADASLLVLAPRGHESFVKAALDAGAQGCLMLPVDAKQVAGMVLHARAGGAAN